MEPDAVLAQLTQAYRAACKAPEFNAMAHKTVHSVAQMLTVALRDPNQYMVMTPQVAALPAGAQDLMCRRVQDELVLYTLSLLAAGILCKTPQGTPDTEAATRQRLEKYKQGLEALTLATRTDGQPMYFGSEVN